MAGPSHQGGVIQVTPGSVMSERSQRLIGLSAGAHNMGTRPKWYPVQVDSYLTMNLHRSQCEGRGFIAVEAIVPSSPQGCDVTTD